MTPSRQPRPQSRGALIAESVLLPAQKSRDIEMIVLGYLRTSNSPAIRFIRAGGARRLRARLSAGRLGRSQDLGPLKLRHGRRRGHGCRRGSGLALVTGDAECGQLLQERPAARFRRGNAVLRVAQRTQLVLGQLRQVLDLRHAGRPKDRLLRGGRNEFLVLRFLRFEAGLDRLGEGGRREGLLLANIRNGGGRRLSLGWSRASPAGRKGPRPREGVGPWLGVDRLDLSDRLLIDAGGDDRNAHHAIERRIESGAEDDVGLLVDLLANAAPRP